MKFRGDDCELLPGLWSAVQSPGGSVSVNMIQRMACVAAASFDDKAARAILLGDRKYIDSVRVTPQYSRRLTEATPRRNTVKTGNESTAPNERNEAKATPQYSSAITEARPRREAANPNNDPGGCYDTKRTGVTPWHSYAITKATPRLNDAKANNEPCEYANACTAVVSPRLLRADTEAAPRREFCDADGSAVIETPTPNLFDRLVDPLEVEPVNDVVTPEPASGIAPQEVPAPGIARLMELS